MADAIDMANDVVQTSLDRALANRAISMTIKTSPLCEECGEEIPHARRVAVPHASTCIECQSYRELKARGIRS